MPVRECAISGPAAACPAAFRRFWSPFATVHARAHIGCRASAEVRRNGFLSWRALRRPQRQSEQHRKHAFRPHVLAFLTRTVRGYTQRPFLRFPAIVQL
jgi:hypothetical protein